MSRIHIRIRNKLMSRILIRIRIRNYHWGLGLLKNKCSDKNINFNIKSSISRKFHRQGSGSGSEKTCGQDPDSIWIQNDPPGRIRIRN
jgi:hypothetical protein